MTVKLTLYKRQTPTDELVVEAAGVNEAVENWLAERFAVGDRKTYSWTPVSGPGQSVSVFAAGNGGYRVASFSPVG